MTRCDHDTVFQRVFCVTLVAIAFTFTVILTNVFVDIDGILSRNNDKVKIQIVSETEPDVAKKHLRLPPIAIGPRKLYKPLRDERENDFSRSKRSLESQIFFHNKNPKVQSLLKRRLGNLLEALDQEELEATTTESNVELITQLHQSKEVIEEDKNKDENHDQEDILHLAIHNILLQGIMKHTDISEVYNKLQMLVKNIETHNLSKENRSTNKYGGKDFDFNVFAHNLGFKYITLSEEEKHMLNEMVNCAKLRDDINKIEKYKQSDVRKLAKHKHPKLLIKTLIDITNRNKGLLDNISLSKENIKGIVKLIYNGKVVKFGKKDGYNNKGRNDYKETDIVKFSENNRDEKPLSTETVELLQKGQIRNSSHFTELIEQYINQTPVNIESDVKRLKRQIKIRYENDKVRVPKIKQEKEKDEELYVEIETHFNSKGITGEKRKKLIRNLIKKIKNAINTDVNALKASKTKHKHVQVKKRVQSPFNKSEKVVFNKIIAPVTKIIQRNSDPISKVQTALNPMPRVADKNGEDWKRIYYGPGFLTQSKSLNSAELGENEIEYNKISSNNEIPQRTQKPLNPENNAETLDSNTYFALGNLKFFIKNIDNGGMTIGFNQYTDEAPDPENIKVFTGIENFVSAYQNNERDSTEDTSINSDNLIMSNEDHSIVKREVNNKNNKNAIMRKSIKELNDLDYHSNEYKIIFNAGFLPFDNYQEIYDDKNKTLAVTINKESPNYFNEDYNTGSITANIKLEDVSDLINSEKLKPSEILSLANILNRSKRSLTLKKFSNLQNKLKINRYLNTGRKLNKKITIKKKRSKRHIDKIRIIATDASKPRHSLEDIYFMSGENIEENRAVVKDDLRKSNKIDNERQNENNPTFISEVYDEPSYSYLFGRTRHNPLMAKYPHIFMEEISRSKEEFQPTIITKQIEVKPQVLPAAEPSPGVITTSTPTPKVDAILRALTQAEPRANYKLTMKIFPKNETELNSNGFKVVHTSINKTFDKNGMKYVSLLNVSEISKVEKIIPTVIKSRLPMMSYVDKINPNLKYFQEHQKKLDDLLSQHYRRANGHVYQMNTERNEDRNIIKLTDVPIVTSRSENIQLNKDDFFNKLLSLIKSHTYNPTTVTTETTKTTTTTPSTTESYKTYRNEKMSDEILHQIKRNSELLEKFLNKLDLFYDKPKTDVPTEISNIAKFNFSMMKMWEPPINPPHDTFYKKIIANLDIPKPQDSLPYFYAYKHPENVKPRHLPVATVLYHGHVERNDAVNHRLDTHTALEDNSHRHFIDDPNIKDSKSPSVIIPRMETSKNETSHLLKQN